ncbi:GNAT family N-acetyltransferase [Zhihengliuella sp.]|uniref:bifunctional acetate--CoA ligase family protein/GNAT family N-acetyltransferase n=1 Tax=Zhihengliuella sp. TaxID=1954483 RepID=UPI002811F101|nr:GNAT family N-acetyltransferase [Zhihengliuella sp.]
MAETSRSAEYPDHWEADVVLRDGTTAHLRPIGPGDAAELQRFHGTQSETSVYLRFFTYKSELTPRELERFTRVDHRDRVAFIVLRGGRIIGVGRYDRLDDPVEAEVAFNIADEAQGRGVGSILLEHLAAAARENGIARFSAEVLPENRRMLAVFAEAGYEVARRFDDGVVMLEFPIDPTERSRAVMEAREHRAEARSVAGLLAPASVAVIGASREWGSVGHTLLENLTDGGFAGPVYAVNPDALELGGRIAYGTLAEVPGGVDLAVVAVPEDALLDVVADCAAKGVKGLLVVTGGFDRDPAATARQRELVRLARSHGMRLVGPASLGLVNTDGQVRLNASVAPGMPRRGALGLFSQSAAMGIVMFSAASRRGLGVSSIVSAGNRADVSGNDAMQFWEDDPATSAVGLFLESFGNPRKFSRIARRLARSKPVIVGKSDYMGLRLPPGHTVRTTQAPLGAVDAMLRQSGVIRVRTNEELMDVAQLVATQPLPAGPRIAVVCNSAALAGIVADTAAQARLEPVLLRGDLELDDGQSRALPRLSAAVGAALADERVDAAVVALLPVRGLSLAAPATALLETGRRAGKPVVACFAGQPGNAAPAQGVHDPAVQERGSPAPRSTAQGRTPRADDDRGSGAAVGPQGADGPALQPALPYFSSPGDAAHALGQVVDYVRWRERDFGEVAAPSGIDVDGAERRLAGYLTRVTDTELIRLDPTEASELLSCYGIDVLPSVPFETEEEAAAAAGRVGYPVALKTTDENLRHRLDLGGVRLNIYDEPSLRGNIRDMRRVLEPYGAVGLELQAMAPSGQGCVVRALEDPLLGPLVSYGLAGDAVSLLDDWAHGIPPLSSTELAELVRAPRASRRLFGYQGLPAADVGALEDLLNRVATLKDNHPEIALLEANPVLVAEHGLTVLSVDVRVGNPAERTDSARRAMS